MTDYIKREDAINTIRNTFTGMTADTLELRIKGIPSADAEPVRHGHWDVREPMPMHDIKGNLSWGNWYVCTGCGFATTAIEGHITQYKYCPNCGAFMDKDGESDEID